MQSIRCYRTSHVALFTCSLFINLGTKKMRALISHDASHPCRLMRSHRWPGLPLHTVSNWSDESGVDLTVTQCSSKGFLWLIGQREHLSIHLKGWVRLNRMTPYVQMSAYVLCQLYGKWKHMQNTPTIQQHTYFR